MTGRNSAWNYGRYRRYLSSPQWKAKVAEVRERSGDRCERCRFCHDHEDTHHLTYKNLYNEVITDDPWDGVNELVGLCSTCHDFLHGRSKVDPASYGDDWYGFMRDMLSNGRGIF